MKRPPAAIPFEANVSVTLNIVGASARAAAFSAARAGVSPWCLDFFADADLAELAPVRRIPPARYPGGLSALLAEAPDGPWMYTGGLENRPLAVRRLALDRPLWGVGTAALLTVRSPLTLARLWAAAGVPAPDVLLHPDEVPDGDWLVKPLEGAGGVGVQPFDPDAGPVEHNCYLQRYVGGEPHAAIFLGTPGAARLLGVSRQLTGVSWLNSTGYRYCGSVGPVPLSDELRAKFERLGSALAAACSLRGLFGVDCVVNDAGPWPVEVNPRYTASVEVLEFGGGVPALALHRTAFDPAAPRPEPLSAAAPVVGKAILYARADTPFPANGPWREQMRREPDPFRLPDFADLPHAGDRVEAGRPVLTLFATAGTVDGCVDALQEKAAEASRWLFGR